MQHLDVVLVDRLIRQKDRGFTLLEMLAVLTIVGILMAIAVPSFFAMMTRTQLSSSVERVRDTLETSRIQTTQKNKICNIYISTGNPVVSDCLLSADSTSSGITGVTDGLPSVKLDDQIEIKQVLTQTSTNIFQPVTLLNITYNPRGITRNPTSIVVLSSRSNSTNSENKCLKIEQGVGLINIGTYIAPPTLPPPPPALPPTPPCQ